MNLSYTECVRIVRKRPFALGLERSDKFRIRAKKFTITYKFKEIRGRGGILLVYPRVSYSKIIFKKNQRRLGFGGVGKRGGGE